MKLSRRSFLAGAAAVIAAPSLPAKRVLTTPVSKLAYPRLVAPLGDSHFAMRAIAEGPRPITGMYGLGDRAGLIFKRLAAGSARLEGDNIIFGGDIIHEPAPESRT